MVFSSISFLLVSAASAADPLPAPQNVKVTAVTHKSITFEWDPVDGVDSDSGYQVWYSNGGWAAWTGTPTVTISGLK
ncbi:MAG: fibronectin type III domain-containing protein, partial [Solibacillus sp.]